ncbi:MAG TPA: GntR family transcriptional regulator [Candidatus Binatia bacterium]|nr:GntR family transcriptional regulator [Candidatus Binatia bacterium]
MLQLDTSSIDRNSAEPLYRQIRHLLLQAIKHEQLRPHQQAPSERELSELTGVSRMTVRQALQQLINDGWLYTVPGKGTFVAIDRKIDQNLQRLTGFTEEVQSQGFTPSSRVVSIQVVPAGDREAAVFDIVPGGALIRICRQRLANGVPIGLENAHLVQDAFPGLDRLELDSQSLYKVLQTRYGVYPTWAVQVIEANCADEETARLLNIKPREPVLSMERITYGRDDLPIEYVLSSYRADRSRLRVELHVKRHLGSKILKNLIDAPSEETSGGESAPGSDDVGDPDSV